MFLLTTSSNTNFCCCKFIMRSLFFHWLSLTVSSTSCCALCKSHVSFEVPAIASSWPDTDLNTPVHLSLTLYVPSHPPQPQSSCLSPCLSHPSRLPDSQQTGPDRWPSSVTGSPQRALPVSTHFLLSAPLTWTPPLLTSAYSTHFPAVGTSFQAWMLPFFKLKAV